MSQVTKAQSKRSSTTKKELKSVFKQLATMGLGIFISELDRRLLKPEHVSMIEDHNSQVEESKSSSS